MPEKLELLLEVMIGVQAAADHLAYSIERCKNLIGKNEISMDELERLESLTSRFARLADLLIQRIFRLIDEIELTGAGTLLDRIYRAEKRGWCVASEMIKIRELRNLIAHEYASDKMSEIYTAVAAMSLTLLEIVPKVATYTSNMISRTRT